MWHQGLEYGQVLVAGIGLHVHKQTADVDLGRTGAAVQGAPTDWGDEVDPQLEVAALLIQTLEVWLHPIVVQSPQQGLGKLLVAHGAVGAYLIALAYPTPAVGLYDAVGGACTLKHGVTGQLVLRGVNAGVRMRSALGAYRVLSEALNFVDGPILTGVGHGSGFV